MRVTSASRLITRLLAGVVLSLATSAHAQQTLNDVLNSGNDKARLKVLEQVILDRLIIPGKGISMAAIGNDISALNQTLGSPVKQSEKGIKNKQYLRHYALDDGTQLVVTGKDIIQSLNFIGNAASSYMTSEGVTFGLKSQRVATVYGNADITKSELIYDKLGIAFRFKDNTLVEILVAKPGELTSDDKKSK